MLVAAMQLNVFYEFYFNFYASLRHRSLLQLIVNRYTMAYAFLLSIAILVHFDTKDNFEVP